MRPMSAIATWLLSEEFPELAVELERHLIEGDACDIAEQVRSLRILDRCRCGDDFCGSFYTAISGLRVEGVRVEAAPPRNAGGDVKRCCSVPLEDGSRWRRAPSPEGTVLAGGRPP